MAKVAVVYPAFERYGGEEVHTCGVLRALTDAGHTVTLLTCAFDQALFGTPPCALELLDSTVQGLNPFTSTRGMLAMSRDISERLRAYDLILAGRYPAHVWAARGTHGRPVVWMCFAPTRTLYPEVMNADTGWIPPAADSGNAHARRFGTFMPETVRRAAHRLMDRRAVAHVDHIIVTTPYIRAKTERIYRHPSVLLGWTGVHVPETRMVTPQPMIMIPSRLEPVKNVESVIRALAILHDENRLGGVCAVVVGTGSDADRLRAVAEALGLSDVVAFAGFVLPNERDAYYASCAMVIYPALSEPLGLPVAEAGLFARPVIADLRGGPASMVRSGKTGMLVDTTDPRAIAEAAAYLIQNPHEASRMGSAARTYLSQFMGYEAWAAQFCALIESCLGMSPLRSSSAPL